jgi:diguanylate cyclase (GGDEF)-like protein/PAS domain S-box-containing protein
LGETHGNRRVSASAIPPALVEGFIKLCEGDFSHRLARTLMRDDDDAVAFFFNSIAEELQRILQVSRDQEIKLTDAVEHLTEALVHVRRAERDFRTLFEAAPIPMMLVDGSGKVRACNGRVAAVLGGGSDPIGADLETLFDQPSDCHELLESLRGAGVVEGVAVRLRLPDGQLAWSLVSASTLALGDGTTVLCSFVDLSEQKRVEERLRRVASRDALTDALTRSGFVEVAAHELERAARYARPLCFAMVDLDHFKSINDKHGHHAGDRVLRAVVEKIAAGVRGQDHIGRYGGDEFVLLLPETPIHAACDALERTRAAIASLRFEHPVALTISVGVVALQAGESLEGVLRRADAALYRAKALGRNRVVAA